MKIFIVLFLLIVIENIKIIFNIQGGSYKKNSLKTELLFIAICKNDVGKDLRT